VRLKMTSPKVFKRASLRRVRVPVVSQRRKHGGWPAKLTPHNQAAIDGSTSASPEARHPTLARIMMTKDSLRSLRVFYCHPYSTVRPGLKCRTLGHLPRTTYIGCYNLSAHMLPKLLQCPLCALLHGRVLMHTFLFKPVFLVRAVTARACL